MSNQEPQITIRGLLNTTTAIGSAVEDPAFAPHPTNATLDNAVQKLIRLLDGFVSLVWVEKDGPAIRHCT